MFCSKWCRICWTADINSIVIILQRLAQKLILVLLQLVTPVTDNQKGLGCCSERYYNRWVFLKRTNVGRQVLDAGKFDLLQHVRLNTKIGETSSPSELWKHKLKVLSTITPSIVSFNILDLYYKKNVLQVSYTFKKISHLQSICIIFQSHNFKFKKVTKIQVF